MVTDRWLLPLSTSCRVARDHLFERQNATYCYIAYALEGLRLPHLRLRSGEFRSAPNEAGEQERPGLGCRPPIRVKACHLRCHYIHHKSGHCLIWGSGSAEAVSTKWGLRAKSCWSWVSTSHNDRERSDALKATAVTNAS